MFREYYNHQSTKDLYEENENKNDIVVKYLNESLINLRNSINSNEIPENENPKKVVNIVETILHINKQQKGVWRTLGLAKRIKILTPKQMLQRIPIPLVQKKQVLRLKTY